MSSVLKGTGLSKSYPGVKALDEVSIEVYGGEVLAVVGENGAGKSTLMKILSGVANADSGKLFSYERNVVFHSVRDALDSGVALIHQELNLAEDLSVAANLFLGHEPSKLGFLDKKTLAKESLILLAKVGLNVDPHTSVADLPIGKQQLVEIARALSYDAQVLIFDEPSSSLSQAETETLFDLIANLKSNGIGIVYISHRLNEVVSIADRVIVLKDGRFQGELAKGQIEKERMISLMVGRDLTATSAHTSVSSDEEILRLEKVVTWEYPEMENSLSLMKGEILGIAGLVGAGRTSLLEGLFGLPPFLSGELSIEGRRNSISSAKEARALGLGLVPEDRKLNGLLLEKSVGENISLSSLSRDARLGFVDAEKEESLIARGIERLAIKTASSRNKAEELSGGNQQKIVVAKWLERNPKILLMDEPTRGVDVGAKKEIYELMKTQAARGKSILFVSSDLEELLRISDRIAVMSRGRIVSVLNRSEFTEALIMSLATEEGQVAA